MAVALWLPRLRGPIDLRYDAGTYYTLGTALAEGRGYRLLYEPGEIAAVQYPPLLPAIVAGHQWLTGSADPAVTGTALRWTWFALFVAYALAVYAFGRRWLDPGWACLASLLVLLNLQLLWLSDTLFAELPFALAALLFLLRTHADERLGAAAMLGAATYLLRASGVAILVAWIADALLQRRALESAARAVLAAVPILAWQAYVGDVQQRPEWSAPAYAYQRAAYQFANVPYDANLAYRDSFRPERGLATAVDWRERVIANLLVLPIHLGESVSVRAEGPLRPVLRADVPPEPPSTALAVSRAGFAAIGLVAAAGQVLLFARGGRVAVLFWTGSIALMALTPWPSQFGRYLMPLAPVTAVGLVLVMAVAAQSKNRLLQTALAAALGIVLAAQILVLGAVFGARHEPTDTPGHSLFFYRQAWRDHDAALAWLGKTAPADAITATSTPSRVWLTSGGRAVLPPFESDVATAARLLDDVPVTYLVIDDLDFLDVSRRYAEPVVSAYPDQWALVYGTTGRGTRIYRRTEES